VHLRAAKCSVAIEWLLLHILFKYRLKVCSIYYNVYIAVFSADLPAREEYTNSVEAIY